MKTGRASKDSARGSAGRAASALGHWLEDSGALTARDARTAANAFADMLRSGELTKDDPRVVDLLDVFLRSAGSETPRIAHAAQPRRHAVDLVTYLFADRDLAPLLAEPDVRRLLVAVVQERHPPETEMGAAMADVLSRVDDGLGLAPFDEHYELAAVASGARREKVAGSSWDVTVATILAELVVSGWEDESSEAKMRHVRVFAIAVLFRLQPDDLIRTRSRRDGQRKKAVLAARRGQVRRAQGRGRQPGSLGVETKRRIAAFVTRYRNQPADVRAGIANGLPAKAMVEAHAVEFDISEQTAYRDWAKAKERMGSSYPSHSANISH